MKRIFCLCLMSGFLFSLGALAQVSSSTQPGAHAGIYIKVGQASLKKSLLAMPAFQISSAMTPKARALGTNLFNTVYNDLVVSDYFTFIKPDAYLEDPSKVGLLPAPGSPNGFHFASWQQIQTDFLIRCGVEITGSKLKLTSYVYYVPQAKLVFGKRYTAPTSEVREIAHTFANDILKKLTGKKGFFLTKFVVVSDRFDDNRPLGKRQKEVYIMDWDAHNMHRVSYQHSIALSPTWSPHGHEIAYTDYAYHVKARTRNPDLFLYNLKTHRRWLLSYHKGINSGAAFMTDSRDVLLSRGPNPDIVEINRSGRFIRRLTHGPVGSMNVEAAPSPDGTKIAFSSDRGGRPQIYLMNSDGTHQHPLTFHGDYNSNPSWSPDGKEIVFAGYPPHADNFDLYLLNVKTKQLRRLTESHYANGRPANSDAPSFSPDGRRIVFTSDRSGTNQLYMIKPNGTDERRITHDHANYYKPKWSPFLDN